jgi:hypothetical protein
MRLKEASLSEILLVACDQSYDTNAVSGVLKSFEDSNTEGADVPPAAMPTGWTALGLDQWNIVQRYDDANTGFGAILYRKPNADGKADYIVALQGTRGPNIQDWSGNLIYGWDKWASKDGGQTLIQDLIRLRDVHKIHFTGQSLGGALAQYALYDYAVALNNQHLSNAEIPGFDPTSATLTTYNGLGGVDGLAQNEPTFLPSLVAQVDTVHYWVTNDLVNRISPNINGAGNEYLLNFTQANLETGNLLRREDGTPIALGTADAHRIESGFYYGANMADKVGRTDWPLDFTEAKQQDIVPLNIAALSRVGTSLAWLSN